jgi:putative drug exporter of the RND superfamily
MQATTYTVIERIGRWCYRRRVLSVLLSFAVLGGLWALAAPFGGQFVQSASLPGTESQQAADRLAAAGFDMQGAQGGLIVVHSREGVREPAVEDAVTGLIDRITVEITDATVVDPYDEHGGGFVSLDGQVAIAPVDFGQGSLDATVVAATEIMQLRDEVVLPEGVVVEFGGDAFAEEPDFASTGIGLLAAAAILFVAFGSLLAMVLPIATALLAVGCGMAVVQLAARMIDTPPFAPAAVAMIALGAGINYALFIVTRFREELANGLAADDASGRAIATAGRSAVFAAATVVTSLLGLLIIGIADVQSLAVSIIAAVLFVMLGSITLLPALLGFVGDRIDRVGLADRHRTVLADVQTSRWYRWARRVQRRPALAAAASLAFLLVVAAPALQMQLGMADATTRTEDDTTRRAHELVAEHVSAGANGPLLLAVALPANTDPVGPLTTLTARLDMHPSVDAVLPAIVSNDQATAMMQIVPFTGPQDPETIALVNDLRETVLPRYEQDTGTNVLVSGMVAAGIDFAQINATMLPWFIAAVLLASFVLLAIIFRSILVPAKAVLVNLLSVGTSYGVIVAVFQWGWLGDLFGLGGTGPIEPWIPVMLFAITFGLSIDYEVFLLSRIRERFDATGDNSEAVAYGLARSARLIFAAAATMVCVFGAFALLAARELQMLGLGLAVAIAIDATVVRLVAVPATMEWLGERNWWLHSRGARSGAPRGTLHRGAD